MQLAINFRAARCAVCAVPLGGALVGCADCELAYHDDCWAFNGGCAIYGCRPRAAQERRLADMVEWSEVSAEPEDQRRGTLGLVCLAIIFAMAWMQPKYTGGWYEPSQAEHALLGW